MKKKSFINDVFRIVPASLGGFILLLAWILYAVEPHLSIMIIFSICSACWLIWFMYVIWTGRLTRVTIYEDRIKWNRHFKSKTVYLDDIVIKEVRPVRHHQWCMIIIEHHNCELYMGLTNSRHMAKLLEILKPSKFTNVLKEEKKKCDEWGFNSAI